MTDQTSVCGILGCFVKEPHGHTMTGGEQTPATRAVREDYPFEPDWRIRMYCQSCAFSFVDNPPAAATTACPKCSGAHWASQPPRDAFGRFRKHEDAHV